MTQIKDLTESKKRFNIFEKRYLFYNNLNLCL